MSEGIYQRALDIWDTMYASSVNKMRKEECASDMEKLIRLSKDTSLEVLSKQKLSRNEEQVVFIKHWKDKPEDKGIEDGTVIEEE